MAFGDPQPNQLPWLQQASTSMQLMMLVFICIVCGSVAVFLSALAGMLFWNLPADALNHYSEYGAAGLAFLKFSQLISSVGLFLLPPVVFAFLKRRQISVFLRTHQKPAFRLAVFAVVLMWIQLPWINYLGQWNNSLEFGGPFSDLYHALRAREDAAGAMIEDFLAMPRISDLLFALLMVAVVPAIGEELLFRSTLQPMLIRLTRNPHAGVWLTAFIFSFIHFQFFGFVPRMLIGVYLGYLFLWTRNSWYPIAAHMANNGIAVLGYYFLQHHFTNQSTDDLGTGQTGFWQFLGSAVLTLAGMWWFRKQFPGPLRQSNHNSVL